MPGQPATCFLRCFKRFDPGNFYQSICAQFQYTDGIFREIFRFFLFDPGFTRVFEVGFDFENDKAAVLCDYSIIAAGYLFFISASTGSLDKKFGITFLRRDGINKPLPIVGDQALTNALPAVVYGMIKRILLRQGPNR